MKHLRILLICLFLISTTCKDDHKMKKDKSDDPQASKQPVQPNANLNIEKKTLTPSLTPSLTATTPTVSMSSAPTNTVQSAPRTTSLKDFFGKTSKDNENLAWKALGYFLGGIACFFISIHVICWNERRAVKETEFHDFIRKEERCGVINEGAKIDASQINPNKSYIVTGGLNLLNEAHIQEFTDEGYKFRDNLAIMKLECESFSSSFDEETNRTVKRWAYAGSGSDGRYNNQYHYGQAAISSNYLVDLSLLNHLVDSRQTASVSDNNYIHQFSQKDIDVLNKIYKKNANNNVQVIVKGTYLYILRGRDSEISNIDIDNFNFTSEDRRVQVKYVSILF